MVKIEKLKILQGTDQIGREKWEAFLNAHPHGSPFQSPAFFDFFNTVSSVQAAKVYAMEEAGQLCALCVVTLQKEPGPKGFFSRRAVVYGGPLLAGDEAANLRYLLGVIERDLRHRVIYLEIRNYFDYHHLYPVFESGQWQYLPYLNVQLPLKNRTLDEVMSGMKYNRRRQIRSSFEEGASVQEAETEEEIRALYDILEELYQNRVRVPLPGYAYFQQLHYSGVGKIFIVKHKELVIGGAFCMFQAGKGIYTVYYCGLREYHDKIYPTHLAVLAAAEFGIQHGLSHLDFMGAGLKGEEYGVRKYKLEFGGELLEHGRFLKILNPPLYRIGKWGLETLKKLK